MPYLSIVEYSQLAVDGDRRNMPMPAEPCAYAHPPLDIGEEANASEPFKNGTRFITFKVLDQRCSIKIGPAGETEAVSGEDVWDEGERGFKGVAPGHVISVIAVD